MIVRIPSSLLLALTSKFYFAKNWITPYILRNVDDWGRSELTDRNVELYPQFFLELITTQLRFYMVSPQLVLLMIEHVANWTQYSGYVRIFA